MKLNQLEANKVKNYIYGGKAILTIKSTVSGRHFTYFIEKAKFGEVYFIKGLTGDDNTNLDNYKYFGFLKYDFFNFGAEKSKIGFDANSVQAFMYVVKIIMGGAIDSRVEFYHSGSCGRCGRMLTNPEALAIGLGSECASKIR